MRVETIGNATLYLADNADVMPDLTGVDVVITDPPFGLNFKGKQKSKGKVHTYQDDEAHYRSAILPRIKFAIEHFPRAAIFCGHRRMWEYPEPNDIGGVFCHGSTSVSNWGFRCFSPVLFYGDSPYLTKKDTITKKALGARPTATVIQLKREDRSLLDTRDHPCPKPLEYMNWAVEIASLAGETVLDPFMGSGQTGVACLGLESGQRKFIGIEKDEQFFDTACAQLDAAQTMWSNKQREPKKGFIY